MAMRAYTEPATSPIRTNWTNSVIAASLQCTRAAEPPVPPPPAPGGSRLRRLVHDPDQLEPPVLDAADGEVLEGDVAVGVEAPLPEGALVEVLGRQDGLEDRLPVLLADGLDPLQDHLRGLVPVDGVRLRVLVFV